MPLTNGSDRGKQPDTNFLSLHLGASSTSRPSKVQKLLNTAAPCIHRPPLSFTALLTSTDDNDILALNSLQPGIGVDAQHHIDRLISLHESEINTLMANHAMQGECLRRKLRETLRVQHESIRHMADEIAVKKLMEKEYDLQLKLAKKEELERMIEQYRAEVDALMTRVKQLEEEASTLQSDLEKATAAGFCNAEKQQEDAESFFDDPNVERLRYKCRLCKKENAMIMMWPCRHVCTCKKCNDGVTLCPVCLKKKETSIEVRLPGD